MLFRSLCVIFLLTIVLSVLLRVADYDYPFGIFKLFLNSFRHCSFWEDSSYSHVFCLMKMKNFSRWHYKHHSCWQNSVRGDEFFFLHIRHIQQELAVNCEQLPCRIKIKWDSLWMTSQTLFVLCSKINWTSTFRGEHFKSFSKSVTRIASGTMIFVFSWWNYKNIVICSIPTVFGYNWYSSCREDYCFVFWPIRNKNCVWLPIVCLIKMKWWYL